MTNQTNSFESKAKDVIILIAIIIIFILGGMLERKDYEDMIKIKSETQYAYDEAYADSVSTQEYINTHSSNDELYWEAVSNRDALAIELARLRIDLNL